jgi:MFS family permease
MKRSPLIILFITLLIDMLGFGMILPLLPLYIQHYGGAPWVGGLLMAAFSAMQLIFAPIWGRLSDRYGRRPFILLSLFGSAVSYFFFGAAGSLAVLFVARLASGILTAASIPTAQAYIADVTPPEKRAGGMAMLGAGFGLGFAFGPVIGGYLSRFALFGFSPLATPALFAAGLALANSVWALLMLPESHTDRSDTAHTEQGLRDLIPGIFRALQHPSVGAQLLVFAFMNFAFAAVESSFSWLVILRFHPQITHMAVQAWNQAHASTPFAELPLKLQTELIEKSATGVTSQLFAIVGITVLVVQVAVMRGLARRVGENRMVMLGAFLLTGSLIGIALVSSLPALRLLSALIAIGNAVVSPSLSALITQAAGPRDRGTVSGAQQGLASMARVIAPPINNTLVGLNTAIPFFSSAVLMGVAFVLSLRLRPLDRLAPQNSPQLAEERGQG